MSYLLRNTREPAISSTQDSTRATIHTHHEFDDDFRGIHKCILMWLEHVALLALPYELLVSVYLSIKIYDDGWDVFSLLAVLALLLATLLRLCETRATEQE